MLFFLPQSCLQQIGILRQLALSTRHQTIDNRIESPFINVADTIDEQEAVRIELGEVLLLHICHQSLHLLAASTGLRTIGRIIHTQRLGCLLIAELLTTIERLGHLLLHASEEDIAIEYRLKLVEPRQTEGDARQLNLRVFEVLVLLFHHIGRQSLSKFLQSTPFVADELPKAFLHP